MTTGTFLINQEEQRSLGLLLRDEKLYIFIYLFIPGCSFYSPGLNIGQLTRQNVKSTKCSSISLRQDFVNECDRLRLLQLLAEEMATSSNILAWEILWIEQPSLLSMGLQRVGHNSATIQLQSQINAFQNCAD